MTRGLAVRTAAASDQAPARFLAENEGMRAAGFREMTDVLRTKAPLRADLPVDRATDVMLSLLSPSAYRSLVVERGWSHDEWVAWTSEAIVALVFETLGGSGTEPTSR